MLKIVNLGGVEWTAIDRRWRPGLPGPASLSPAAVNLLRTGTDYGGQPFDGPVFTDDLSTMKAITDVYSVPEAVLPFNTTVWPA